MPVSHVIMGSVVVEDIKETKLTPALEQVVIAAHLVHNLIQRATSCYPLVGGAGGVLPRTVRIAGVGTPRTVHMTGNRRGGIDRAVSMGTADMVCIRASGRCTRGLSASSTVLGMHYLPYIGAIGRMTSFGSDDGRVRIASSAAIVAVAASSPGGGVHITGRAQFQ